MPPYSNLSCSPLLNVILVAPVRRTMNAATFVFSPPWDLPNWDEEILDPTFFDYFGLE